LERLLTHVRQQHTRLFILIALYTGARSGAILELTWDRVDLETRRIDFGAGRGLKRRSIVPINDELFDVMVNAFDAANCKWVISHGARRLASIRHGFRMAVADAQLKDVTPHVLRHTAASWMLQAGVPIEEVAAYLGNSKEIVRRVYGHHSPTYLQGASQALSRQRGLDNQSSMNQKNARVS
jgi:integrase